MDPAVQDILNYLQQIVFVDFMPLIRTIIVFFATTKALDSYQLIRDYYPKNIKQVELPPDIMETVPHIDEKRILGLKYGEKVLQFAHKLIEVFPREVLNNFYYNISYVKIQDLNKKRLVFSTNTVGTHDTMTNTIQIEEKHASATINHELFHMSSSKYENGVIYSGFSQTAGFFKRDIGDGINEGYTEVLTNRYFYPTINSSFTYSYLEDVAKHLEKIVGKEKMEELYLKADLLGLINELKQYATEDEIMEFLTSTDFILVHLGDYKFKPFENGY